MIEITKKELEKRYRTTKTKDLARELGISCPTLLRYLKKVGIKLKERGDGWALRERKFSVVEE